MITEEAKKSRMQRPGLENTSRKQSNTMREASRIPDSIPQEEVFDNVKTYITHNKGAKWELIRAPTQTSKGSPIDCNVEDDCSLHLEVYSQGSTLAPVYSTETSIGIVLGTGNLGKRLSKVTEPKNMYISRDGGLNWKSVKAGAHIYEIGDHGSIIVAAKHDEAV